MRWRLALLGDPRFTGAVALLAANDHAFKEWWPGLVTGKLSDVAGVAVVAVVVSVLAGWRLGVGATAAAFTALKLAPPVAAFAAPLLGGTSRTDPTDLVALAVLVPVGWWLRAATPTAAGHGARLGVAGTVLAGAAVTVAGLATGATSCAEVSSVDAVGVGEDGTLVAALDDDREPWASTDGGTTWTRSSRRRPPAATEDCAGATCWRVRSGVALEECADGVCEPAFEFSAEARRRMGHVAACGIDRDHDFLAVATGSDDEGPVTLVAMGQQGVLVHRGDETARVPVADAEPLPIGGLPSWTANLAIAPLALLVLTPIVALIARRRGGRPVAAALVGGLGTVALLVVTFPVLFFVADGRTAGLSLTVAAATVFALSLLLAWRRGRPVAEPPWPPWPPPPVG